ncbi:hypothetical protein [Streptomyces sp. H27-S2]|uniref:hypothetical protein n=1 Tax=Streptomyces antarcticus TaxID=2996458 RepID=UPI00226F27A9|nr:hypothetical protein [Streptomyces sp. H27-S2]MCY0954781.1 hypothetical protein [Streptomyces sp. H27-S2]
MSATNHQQQFPLQQQPDVLQPSPLPAFVPRTDPLVLLLLVLVVVLLLGAVAYLCWEHLSLAAPCGAAGAIGAVLAAAVGIAVTSRGR